MRSEGLVYAPPLRSQDGWTQRRKDTANQLPSRWVASRWHRRTSGIDVQTRIVCQTLRRVIPACLQPGGLHPPALPPQPPNPAQPTTGGRRVQPRQTRGRILCARSQHSFTPRHAWFNRKQIPGAVARPPHPTLTAATAPLPTTGPICGVWPTPSAAAWTPPSTSTSCWA